MSDVETHAHQVAETKPPRWLLQPSSGAAIVTRHSPSRRNKASAMASAAVAARRLDSARQQKAPFANTPEDRQAQTAVLLMIWLPAHCCASSLFRHCCWFALSGGRPRLWPSSLRSRRSYPSGSREERWRVRRVVPPRLSELREAPASPTAGGYSWRLVVDRCSFPRSVWRRQLVIPAAHSPAQRRSSMARKA